MAIPKPTDLLRDAIDAARRALQSLEADQVSPRVRRVKAISGGSLPPPLAKSLLDELDSNGVLRGRALDAWEGEIPATGRARAGHAFLARGDGWLEIIVEEAIALGERHGSAADESVVLERDALAAEVAAGREQRRREREEFETRERRLRDALESERAPGRAQSQAEQRAQARLEEERAAWEVAAAATSADLAAARAEIDRLQESVRVERRARAELAAAIDDGGIGGLPTDPMALARHLDEIAAHASALAERPSGDPQQVSGADCSARLDPTVVPDSPEAIDWLIREWACPILVDGYNLGFRLGPLEPAPARERALEVARRLSLAASAAPIVTVVFDSDVEGGHGGGRSGRVEWLFTDGQTADDVIVERCGSGPPKVVISNDREVRERAEALGARSLWVDALAAWSRRR